MMQEKSPRTQTLNKNDLQTKLPHCFALDVIFICSVFKQLIEERDLLLTENL